MEVPVAVVVGLVMLVGGIIVADLVGYAVVQSLKADWYRIRKRLGKEEA